MLQHKSLTLVDGAGQRRPGVLIWHSGIADWKSNSLVIRQSARVDYI